MIDDQGFQCPSHPAAGKFRPLGCCGGGVLAPPVPAVITPVTPDPHQQRRGAVAERLVGEGPGDRASRGGPRAARAAPRILLGEPALKHRPFGQEPLTDSDQAEFLQAREGRQIGAVEGSVGHVEVFLMASVRTSIIGRPRRLSRHRRAHPGTPDLPPRVRRAANHFHWHGDAFTDGQLIDTITPRHGNTKTETKRRRREPVWTPRSIPGIGARSGPTPASGPRGTGTR